MAHEKSIPFLVMASEMWAFDVDGTVIDSLTGTSLRPGTRELLGALRGSGHRVVWWSAGGADHARQRAEHVGVVDLVDAFHGKDERGADGRYVADHLVENGGVVVFVDDRPEDLPLGARFVAVSPYLGHNLLDRGLARALEALSSAGGAGTGHL